MVKKVIETSAEKTPAAPDPAAVHPYAATDPIPVPEALESDTDTAWALWEDLTRRQNSGPETSFANTVADTLPISLSVKSPKPQP
jgi:hypothetical protein